MKKYILISLSLLLVLKLSSQDIFGYILDSDGNAVFGSSIMKSDYSSGVEANEFGFYSFNIKGDSLSLLVSALGYQSISFYTTRNGEKSIRKDFRLLPDSFDIVIIDGQRYENANANNKYQINYKVLDKISTIASIDDPIKKIEFLPGVNSTFEGSSDLSIRGALPEENLIILDGAPMYSSNHFLGFYSPFNGEIVDNITLNKGGISPKYGGRNASVITINTLTFLEKPLRKLSVGTISSSLTYGLPISPKMTIIGAARANYLGLLQLPQYIRFQSGNRDSYANYNIYDLNLKFSYKISPKQKLFVSAFNGTDNSNNGFKFQEKQERFNNFQWNNKTLSVRYSNIFTSKIFYHSLIYYNNYSSRQVVQTFLDKNLQDDVVLRNNTNSIHLDNHIEYQFKNQLLFEFGANATWFIASPIDNRIEFEGNDPIIKLERIKSNEVSIYGNVNFNHEALNLNVGMRLSRYQESNQIQLYPELRTSANLFISEFISLTSSYDRMHQNLHRVNTINNTFAYDVWIPHLISFGKNTADLYAMGVDISFNPKHDLALSFFLRNTNNAVTYKDGVNFITSDSNIENSLLKSGKGRAFGMEVAYNITSDFYELLIAYTLSKSNRRFDEVNNGSWYPFQYQRDHVLSLNYIFDLTDKWKVTSRFSFQNGGYQTLPTYITPSLDGNNIIQQIDGRNNSKLPIQHRLDLLFQYNYKNKQNKESSWSFSLFNAYGAKNVFSQSILFSRDQPTYDPELLNTSFIRFIPGIQYKVKW